MKGGSDMKIVMWNNKKEVEFDSIPEKQGIYLIACQCSNGKNIVVYVGQSNDLRRRAKEHWSDNEQNKDLKNAIKKYKNAFTYFYAVLDSARDLDGCEKYLFDCYEPQFTDRTPEAEPIEIALTNSVSKGRVNF